MIQVRSHAQKYFKKLRRTQSSNSLASFSDDEGAPPEVASAKRPCLDRVDATEGFALLTAAAELLDGDRKRRKVDDDDAREVAAVPVSPVEPLSPTVPANPGRAFAPPPAAPRAAPPLAFAPRPQPPLADAAAPSTSSPGYAAFAPPPPAPLARPDAPPPLAAVTYRRPLPMPTAAPQGFYNHFLVGRPAPAPYSAFPAC